MQRIICAAIMLIVLGTAHRSCRKSFNHDFIPDEVAVTKPLTYYIHIPGKDGYYTIRPETTTTGKRIWTVGANEVEPKRLKLVREHLNELGFIVFDLAPSAGAEFSVVGNALEWDSLARSIRVIELGQ